jgi:hypothetical protein
LCCREHHTHTFVWQPLAPDAAWRVSCFPIDITWRQSGLQVVAMVTKQRWDVPWRHASGCVWQCGVTAWAVLLVHPCIINFANTTTIAHFQAPLPSSCTPAPPPNAHLPTRCREDLPSRSGTTHIPSQALFLVTNEGLGPLLLQPPPPSTPVDIAERAVSCSVSSAVPRKLHVCGPSKSVACGCLRAAACSPGKVCMVKKRGDEKEGSRREASADHRPLLASALSFPCMFFSPAWLASMRSCPPSTARH